LTRFLTWRFTSAQPDIPAAVAKLMQKDSALADMFHGPFKAYIDCEHVEKQIDLAIGSEPEKAFSEYEQQFALFHPMFYYEFSYRGGGDFVPPPIPTPRSRPLNEPFRLRMCLLGTDLTDPSPPAAPHPNAAAAHSGGGNQRGAGNAHGNETEKSTGNWRQRENQSNANANRYVPPHLRPGAPKFRNNDRGNNDHYQQRDGYQQQQRGNGGYQQQQQQQGGGRQRRQQQYQQEEYIEAAETPAPSSAQPNPAAQQFFPQMTPEQFVALQQQLAAMQVAAAPNGFPQMPYAPPAMRPTEFGPDGLPIRHAQAQPTFQDPAIVSFSPYAGASPYGAPFPFAGAMPPMMYPGMMMPPNMMAPPGHPAAPGQRPPQ
jgi:hypothetical protein